MGLADGDSLRGFRRDIRSGFVAWPLWLLGVGDHAPKRGFGWEILDQVEQLGRVEVILAFED
jgi:hypothetical protein